MIICFQIFVLSIITFLLPALFVLRHHIYYIKVKKSFFTNIAVLYIKRSTFNTDDHAKIRLAKYWSYGQKTSKTWQNGQKCRVFVPLG